MNVQVPLGAQISNAAQVVISIGGATANVVTMAVQPPLVATPTLTSIAPNAGTAGRVLSVLITGANTTFVQGQTIANFGAGTSVGGSALGQSGMVKVINSTTASAQVTIDPSASAGSRTVVVTTGAQTASLSNGFTVQSSPGQLGPLTISSTLPSSGATGISLTPVIQITFNEPLDPATIGPSSFALASARAMLPATVTVDSMAMIVTLTPSGLLTPGTYTVTIGALVRNVAESPLGSPYSFSFTTVVPTSVNGTLTLPAGIDPTTLSIFSFGGRTTTGSSSGGFSASVNPVGNTLVAAMVPGKAFGFLAVAISAASGGSTNSVSTSSDADAQDRVRRTRWQVTASATAVNAQNNLVADLQTTAETLVFMSPYLFTINPQNASTILGAIAQDPATTQLAQALGQSLTETDPLSDSSVQSAIRTAVQAVAQTLFAQTAAQALVAHRSNDEPAKAMRFAVTNSTASTSVAPATIVETPYCWPTLSNGGAGLPCLDLDYLNFQNVTIDPTSGNYQVNPQNCIPGVLGCAVGWLVRAVPIGSNPLGIVGNLDSFGPESPQVVGEPSSCSAASPCYSAWVLGAARFKTLMFSKTS